MEAEKKTILLMDKNYGRYVFEFGQFSREQGFTPVPFADVSEGLKHLAMQPENVVAVLLGLSFSKGGYEGLDALKKIKAADPHLPVILLTVGSSEEELAKAAEGLRLGAFSYIIKDRLDTVSLFHILKAAVDQYVQNRELGRYRNLKESFTAKAAAYKQVIYTAELILANNLEKHLMFSPLFESRVKTFDSFYNKILKKEAEEGPITDAYQRFNDLAGLRIVAYNSEDMDKAVALLRQTDDFIDANGRPEIFVDYKDTEAGYRAAHLDLMLNPAKRAGLAEYQPLMGLSFEVQVKTIFAHSWSKIYHKLGYKEHPTGVLAEEIQEQLNRDFKSAAVTLEEIEKQINTLCLRYTGPQTPNRS
ncbi:hypothetical protein [Mucilaginibacter sp. HD30]